MRMGLITRHFPPQRCGVGDYTHRLAEELARRGCEVRVITSKDWEGVRCRPQEGVVVLPVIEKWNLAGLFRVARTVQLQGLQVVNVQYVPQLYGKYGIALSIAFLPWMLRRHPRCRVVTTLHEMYQPCSGKPSLLISGLIQRMALLLIIRFSHQIVVTTKDRYQRLCQLFPLRTEDIALIPVGSPIPRVDVSHLDREKLRKKLGLGADTLVLTFFGMAAAGKEIGSVFASLRQLLVGGLSARLLWVGGNEADVPSRMRAALESLKGHVTFLGYVASEDVSRYLSLTDIFVLPIDNGVSTRRTTLMAAMAHGLPIVTTVGQHTDTNLFTPDAFSLVCTGNTHAFVQAVEGLATNANLRKRLGRSARSLYELHFTWLRISQQVIEIIS